MKTTNSHSNLKLKMKTNYQLILLILVFCCSNGFSQTDSLLAVNKKEIRKYHKKIFKFSVDTTLDSLSVYKLVYASSSGWVEGVNYGLSPNQKKYHSGYSIVFNPKIISIAELLNFPEPSEDSLKILSFKDSLFLDPIPLTASNKPIVKVPKHYVVRSKQDNNFKELKNKTYNNTMTNGVILLGGKYLLVVTKDEYIGNSSCSSVVYSYYEKVK